MTTPMVDTVRSIPLGERDVCEPMEAGTEDSGFSFDRDDRDDHFRSQLDDIAKRHPELAEHLDGFPFRSETLGRRRPPRPADQDFHRFASRPFASGRFERFGFPFSDPFDEDQPPQTSPPPQPQPEEDKPRPERGRKQNIQQSNTVDLGQKQEPVNDRNQRSMSAPPPDNRQRYVSSIHIPINRDGGMGDMGKTQSQPQQTQDKPVERVIPIHVEGRDEPVVPKHTGASFSQPQPERIFGHSPSHFTQFVGKPPPERQHGGFGPEVKKQPQPQAQAQPERQAPPQKPQEKKEEKPKEVPKPSTPIDLIQLIQKDVSELMGQVEKFDGLPRDKQYLYLDEMLTRNLLKLDNIDTQGQENIRQARKEAIKCIQSCITILEAKAAANVPKPQEKISEDEKVETSPPTEGEVEKMDVEDKEKVEEVEQKGETEAKVEPVVETTETNNPPVVVEEKMEMDVEDKEKVEEVEQKEETEAKVEPVVETTETNNPPVVVEEKMEVAPEVVAAEDKPQESQVSETTDAKPDEEMQDEEKKSDEKEASQDDSSDDKKEKKKGKKKVVKK
ncbi:BAG domain-containing protein Samui isoform X3 [Zophobas morio]|uniref:BAG domain-containing protein Samui isoform X3 n=1 Tax=Zophobas morio TaxID=2755281 RepID=UPI00308354A2